MVNKLKMLIVIFIVSLLWCIVGMVMVLDVKDNVLIIYIVKKNDILWDIVWLFLDKFWLWLELWCNNI